MSEYTPTTAEVREAWAKRNALYRSTSLARIGHRAHVAADGDRYGAEDFAEFDRWLAAHDREVTVEALRDAADKFMPHPELGLARLADDAADLLRAEADRIEKGRTMARADLEAAAEKYPYWVLDPDDEIGEDYYEVVEMWQNAEADMQRAAYIQGRLDALPEVPGDAVIETMARAIWERYAGHGPWTTLSTERQAPFRKDARAAYVALRGAMQ